MASRERPSNSALPTIKPPRCDCNRPDLKELSGRSHQPVSPASNTHNGCRVSVVNEAGRTVLLGQNQARLAVGEIGVDSDAEVPELHGTAVVDAPLHHLAQGEELGLAHILGVVEIGRVVNTCVRSVKLHLTDHDLPGRELRLAVLLAIFGTHGQKRNCKARGAVCDVCDLNFHFQK